MYISSSIFRVVSDFVSLGASIDYETHNDKDVPTGMILAEATTISILPFAEWRPWGLNQVSPYLLFSFGYNINSFKVSSELNNFCITTFGAGCKVTPDNTFALKGGGGVDLFITKDLALNAEVAWKWNSGNSEGFIGGVSVGEDKFKGDVYSFLFGIRYYWEPERRVFSFNNDWVNH